jgi:hypothetical protein
MVTVMICVVVGLLFLVPVAVLAIGKHIETLGKNSEE